MNERLGQIEARLERIEEKLSAVEQRLAARQPSPGREGEAAGPGVDEHRTPELPAPAGALDGPDVGGLLSLLGRTSIVFGGAYLLRALMESGRLPKSGAVALGIAYALVWLGAADRAAGAGRFTSSLFHGMTAVVIGFPLLWEASTRFGFFAADASAAMLAVLTGLALLVAWHRRLQGLAAAATLAAIVTALALAAGSGQVIPQAVFLVLLGIGALWLSYDRDWHWLRWPPALAADAFVLALLGRALRQPPLERPQAVMVVQLFLLAAYLSSFAARTVVRGRTVVPFEVIQTAAVLMAGLGGALAVAHANGTGAATLGLASATLGAGCYAVAFAFVDRKQGLESNFYLYLTLALVLVLTGGSVLLSRPVLSIVLAALAVAVTWLGARFARVALTLQGGVYGVATAVASGLLASAAFSLLATPAEPATALAFIPLTALAALLACLAIPAPVPPPAALATGARVVLASLAVLGGAGLLIAALAPLLAGTPPDRGVLATVRTGVLAGVAVLLAGASRTKRGEELGWLLYPALALGGVKLLVEDLRFSRPATLFLALALYGAALVAAPRLARRPPMNDRPAPSAGPPRS
jgi:hypothetical protein